MFKAAIWLALAALIAVPIAFAMLSPYLAYRNTAYLIGGFAGIVCLVFLLVQPLLAARYLPGLGLTAARKAHRIIGGLILAGVVIHVVGLYVTSPPDTLDALLLRAPTAFSLYGVSAMWATFLTAMLVLLRRRFRYATWRILHNGLALFVVIATVVHALLIEGAMEPVSKWVLCLAVLLATLMALADLRIIRPFLRRRTRQGAAPD
jgi:predicted ferric reductase